MVASGVIGFLHIPKTGGTSLRSAFAASGRSVWRPTGPRYATDLPDVAGVDVVTGHIPFDVFSRLPVTEWVTVLRDPVDRWLSHYFAEVGQGRRNRAVPGDMACRMLSSFDRPDVEVAAVNLAGFDHVGRTDRLDVTFARYGLTPDTLRRSPRPRGPEVPGWLTDAAIEANQLDLALWGLWNGAA